MPDDTDVPANLQPAPEGFGRSADGSLIADADRVQGPSDILTQYHQATIPEQFPEQIERNRAAGLDASGNPIPGATLSPAAQASVAYEASLHVMETPAVDVPADAPTPETPMAVIPQAHISEFQRLLDEVESIPAHIRAFFAEHFGAHVA